MKTSIPRYRLRPLRLCCIGLLAALLAGCQWLAPMPTQAQTGSPAGSGGTPVPAPPVPVAPPASADASLDATTPPAPVASPAAGTARGKAPAKAGILPALPRLLVLVVVDGLPQRQLLAYRDQLAPDGLARFLAHGAWFSEAYYEDAVTVAGPGHATLLTGAYPHRSGIVANQWRDQNTGEPEYCTGDTAFHYLGQETGPLDGTSPKNLKVQTVGDMLKRADARAKVISVSGKDSGAILPAGKSGTAYMYMPRNGQFASSTYYMQSYPAWVDAFNAGRPADRWFKKAWTPLLPDVAYARSLPDGQDWYAEPDARLPMLMGSLSDDKPGAAYYSQLLQSPFADELTLAFARAAIAGEGLGQDAVPDILAISLSAHDFINHRFSAESRFSHDHLLQLDRMLQDFLRHLDSTLGRDNYIAMLTADNGFMPAPEVSAQQGLNAGRVSGALTLERVNAGLEEEFGPGEWVSFSGPTLLINRQLLVEQRVDPDEVSELARDLLLEQPGVAAAYTRRELDGGGRLEAPFFGAVQRSWHRAVSGDVQFILKPYWMMASRTAATTHGSPYPYDTHVPLLAWGPRWVKPGRVDQRVEMVDIAPTVAAWLGVDAPATSEGRLLPLPK